MLADAFSKAVRNLLLPGVLKLFLLCLLAYTVGWGVLAWLLGGWLAGYIGATGSENGFLHMVGTVGGGMLAWFLFPLLYPLLVSFFDDYMADVIEREDYPHLPKATPPFWPSFAQDVIFTLKALGLNILCLPLYLIPLVNAAVYYGLNGYLLGAQFFRMSAGRRVSRGEADAMIRRHRGKIILAGALVAFCATIPVLNLAAPLLGVATLLHLFHAIKGTVRSEIIPPVTV